MMSQNPFSDKEMLDDGLASQKFITGMYNEAANESKDCKVRDELMSILNEEHQIQSELFDEMTKRGWYPTEDAVQQKIMQAKQKYSNILTSL